MTANCRSMHGEYDTALSGMARRDAEKADYPKSISLLSFNQSVILRTRQQSQGDQTMYISKRKHKTVT